MGLPLTLNALNASRQNNKEINLVFEIEGVSTLFGGVDIKKFVRVGDPDLEVGDPETNENAFYVGGFNLVDDQESLISFGGNGSSSTTTTIRQSLNVDRGESSSITTFTVSLLDQNGLITDLITPDENVSPTFDILGRRCKIYFGFTNTAWPEDYITIFRGLVTDIESGAGTIDFIINHPDNKKRKDLFKEVESELDANITNASTAINLVDASEFLAPITGPDGSVDESFKSYLIINDEIMRFDSISGNTVNIIERGAFSTIPVAHTSGDDVSALYRLEDNIIDIALKLMSSGFNGPFVEDIAIDNFNFVSPTRSVANSIVVKEKDLTDLNGIVVGDFVETSGATNGANNISLSEIIGVEVTPDLDTILTIDGASFVEEVETDAVMNFRSQYDVWPDGMQMLADEIDIAEHLFIKNTFLPSDNMDFRLTEGIENGKEFLEKQVYSPVAAFGLPRKSRASLGYHIGPIPNQDIKTLDFNNIRDPDKLKIKRSLNRFFYNEIIYRYDKDLLEDRFLGGRIVVSQTSKNRIKGGARQLRMDSLGMRSFLNAQNIATQQGNRRLSRYQFGSERIKINPLLGDGFTIEVGDIVLFNGEGLQVSDIKEGSRNFATRLMEVSDKRFNIKNGDVELDLVDTNFDGQQRFGLISPSSKIKTGVSTTEFVLEPSLNPRIGQNEFLKWENLTQTVQKPTRVVIRSTDFTSFNEVSGIQRLEGNKVILTDALSVVPSSGFVMELADYSLQPVDTTLVFAHLSENAGDDFNDGTNTYVLL